MDRYMWKNMVHKFLQVSPLTISPVITLWKELTPTQIGKLLNELMPLLNNVNVTEFIAQQNKQHQLSNNNKAYAEKNNQDNAVLRKPAGCVFSWKTHVSWNIYPTTNMAHLRSESGS